LARTIERSEGAIRKWLRGQSEPAVSDLRAICEVTQTNVEWLVMGRGDPKGGGNVRSPPSGAGGDEPLGPLNYKLMDDVVLAVRLEARFAGTPVTPEKCSSILASVYNLSRMARRVDRESAERIAGLPVV
jgi:hypothetical protein